MMAFSHIKTFFKHLQTSQLGRYLPAEFISFSFPGDIVILASSSNNFTIPSIDSGRSLLKIRKRIGPTALPYGTPLVIFLPI